MRKLLGFILVATLCLFFTPVASAQRQHGGSHEGNHGGFRGSSNPRPAPPVYRNPRNTESRHEQERSRPAPPAMRDRRGDNGIRHDRDRGDDRDFRRDDRDSRHGDRDFRRHFDGRRFDNDWERDHFGFHHRFFVERPIFIGGYYTFWYDDICFDLYDSWPPDWCYCDSVYIEYDPFEDCYVLYNPRHPGVRVRIGVVL